MQRVFVVLALVGVVALTAGCTMRTNERPPLTPATSDRSTFVERRAEELIRRGAPKDAALGKATSEWFNHLLAENRAEPDSRLEIRGLEAALAQRTRERADGRP